MKQKIASPFNFYIGKRCYLLCIAILFCSSCIAQFTVSIRLLNLPVGHNNDAIFIAGSFNGWNPADNKYKFLGQNGETILELHDMQEGAYKFKFTRGQWDKVECTGSGEDIENHLLQLSGDTVLLYNIAGWKDDFASVPKIHTASSNVQIIDTAFYMPQLNKQRRIWIYLPPGYRNYKKRYPVMYMQDGQNVFDAYTSGYGEWGVDECLDSLVKAGEPGCIVVAIDNGGETRMNEYNPFEFVLKDSAASQTFSPQGDEYVDFLAKSLKPWIDKHYRTLRSKENTIIAGSSMGGLISYYAALKYPGVFGKAGIFSPAFWTANGIEQITDSLGYLLKGKFFFYIGMKEGKKHVDNMTSIQEKIGKKSDAMIYSLIDADGSHNEQAWRKWFAEFYNWIMADGYNIITKADN